MNFWVKMSIGILVVLLSLSGCASKKVKKKSLKSTLYQSTKYTSKARHKATMKSYKVMGKRYHPTPIHLGKEMYGISSWYGPNFHGKETSNGEIYDMYARTAAHKTWPMDTMVEVHNLENGKKTVVRINDRGPFVKGRVIDCSYRAGKELGLDKSGIAKVKIRVLGVAGITPRHVMQSQKDSGQNQEPSNIKVVHNAERIGVQVGAFSEREGAEAYLRKYSTHYKQYKAYIQESDKDGSRLYRVWLDGFQTAHEAENFKKHGLI